VLKQIIAAAGVLASAAAGTALLSGTASAQTPAWGGCCASSHRAFGGANRTRNWSGNENENLNHIRLRLHNRNNNIAVARPGGRGGRDTGLGVGTTTGGGL
jgi:hypothetical protein